MAYIHAPGVLSKSWADETIRGAVHNHDSLTADRLTFEPEIGKAYHRPKLPARFSYPRARALRKLVLRAGESLDSDVCGHVPSGRSVMVLKESDGRVFVGADFSEGVKPLGWATRQKDGEMYMAVEATPRAPGTELNCSPKRSSLKTSLALRHSGGGSSPRRTRSQERLEQFNLEVASTRSAPGALERRRAIRRRGGDDRGGGAGGASSSGPGADQFLQRLGEAEQRDTWLGGLWGPEELRRTAQEQLDQAMTNEDGASFETFASRIGRIIIKNELKVSDITSAMDRNGDKSVSRYEFCVGIRKILDAGGKKGEHGGQKEREDIEHLFDALDLDHSGELDLSEVRAARAAFQSAFQSAFQIAFPSTMATLPPLRLLTPLL
jgi:hypothetical protein